MKLLLNNADFDQYLSIIYPRKLETKNKSDTDTSASYLDFFMEFDNLDKLKTLYMISVVTMISLLSNSFSYATTSHCSLHIACMFHNRLDIPWRVHAMEILSIKVYCLQPTCWHKAVSKLTLYFLWTSLTAVIRN